jgi:hypothetical protein
MRTNANIVSEIRELLSAIERDLNPFLRGDCGRYTGYLVENAADLNVLILKLMEGKKCTA